MGFNVDKLWLYDDVVACTISGSFQATIVCMTVMIQSCTLGGWAATRTHPARSYLRASAKNSVSLVHEHFALRINSTISSFHLSARAVFVQSHRFEQDMRRNLN